MHGEPCLARTMKPDGERLSPPPHTCELCKKNPVPFGHIRAGSPVVYMCSDCEKIVAEWERRKKAHHALLSKIFKDREVVK